MSPRPLVLSLMLSTFSACSDTHLQIAPLPPPEEGTQGPVGSDPEPDPPARPPSPWDNMDPGSLPDEHFAVAWYDPEACCMDDAESDDDIWWNQFRWDVVDLMGQVVAEFQPPEPGFSIPETILPSGPGQFFAVTSNDNTTYSNCQRLAWRADATTGQAQSLLRLGWSHLELPQTGQVLDLGWETSVADGIVLPDPLDPGRVWVLGSDVGQYANPLLGPLMSIPVNDPSALVETWEATDLVPPDVFTQAWTVPWMAWYARFFVVDGERVLVLGLDAWLLDGPMDDADGEMEPGPQPVLHKVLIAWSPERGVLDARLDLSALEIGTALSVIPNPTFDEGGALGTAIWPVVGGDGCSMSSFGVWDGATERTITGVAEIYCPELGPAFEASAPTFLYWGPPTGEWSDRLVVSHAGEDVWSWDRLRIGLGERRFDLLQLARMVPVP